MIISADPQCGWRSERPWSPWGCRAQAAVFPRQEFNIFARLKACNALMDNEFQHIFAMGRYAWKDRDGRGAKPETH